MHPIPDWPFAYVFSLSRNRPHDTCSHTACRTNPHVAPCLSALPASILHGAAFVTGERFLTALSELEKHVDERDTHKGAADASSSARAGRALDLVSGQDDEGGGC